MLVIIWKFRAINICTYGSNVLKEIVLLPTRPSTAHSNSTAQNFPIVLSHRITKSCIPLSKHSQSHLLEMEFCPAAVVRMSSTHGWEFIVPEKQMGPVILVRFICRVSSRITCTVILFALNTIWNKAFGKAVNCRGREGKRLSSGQTTGNHPPIGHESRSRTEILTWEAPTTKQERESFDRNVRWIRGALLTFHS